MSFESRNGVINQADYTYFERQWATTFSTDYQDGGQERVMITQQLSATTASFQIQKKSSTPRQQHLT